MDAYHFLYNQLDIALQGDINGDAEVNVLDVVELVNIVLELSEGNNSSDINQDGEINILDIVELVNIILD